MENILFIGRSGLLMYINTHNKQSRGKAKMIHTFKELVQYRGLLWDLAIKDMKVRYRNPYLGFVWALLVPLLMVFIFKFVFSTILRGGVEQYPFFIYLMTAIFPWVFFSSAVESASESIVNNQELIKKTYFPRHIIPMSAVLASLLNFIPAFLVMHFLMLCFGIKPSILILIAPVAILLQTILAAGLALLLSSVYVVLRDVKYIIQIMLMAWFYLSPGIYSLSTIERLSERLLNAYTLNPFTGLFSLYRMALLPDFASTLPTQVNVVWLYAWTAFVCVAVFFIGIFVFKRLEPYFSDLI